jgi:predicted DNA-binding transcriptional regulator AlpA
MVPREVLTEKEVHDYWALSVAWLRKKRRLGDGPIYLKIGKMVRYRRSDIEAYLNTCTVGPITSKSD